MSALKILLVNSKVLRETAKSVSNFDRKTQKLIADLADTLVVQKDPVGVGLAAPQVGKSVRLFVAKIGAKSAPFINPEILHLSKKSNDPSTHSARKSQDSESSGQVPSKKPKGPNDPIAQEPEEKEYIMEGCLSLPHYYGPVKRAYEVKLKYQTPQMVNSKWQMANRTKTFRGLSAQIIQHEVDHLNGKLFIDRLLQQNRKLYEQKGKEWLEVELP